ncbi:ABC transporter ATP-binding protein [Ligilactobacillus pabuli]|uniref:ABC transporter ATP-binding protein n=1 Tax=Ligilactobacillus pabuli TaxID=2886039 RepID=A0ABQ5JI43_9LACO|nr:ATP-binding cassette domain-containing protein [Ligilactobacillus pabuli]GKS81680.1 ABC transporter ATP-binding protein [Ligilactobacillus pabuli]
MQVKVKNVNFSYKKEQILADLSCTFCSGKINYLIGYNGSGKTTLFDLISGARVPSSGTISGRPNAKEVLYQTQNPVVFGALTGRNLQEFIFGVATGHSKIEIDKLSPHFCELYQKLLERKVSDMSVGERRWFVLFLESYLEKKLFLLDEPTSGVDPVSRKQILTSISALASDPQKIIIVTTHDLKNLDSNCYIHLLKDKKMTTFNSYADFVAISDKQEIEDAFAILNS